MYAGFKGEGIFSHLHPLLPRRLALPAYPPFSQYFFSPFSFKDGTRWAPYISLPWAPNLLKPPLPLTPVPPGQSAGGPIDWPLPNIRQRRPRSTRWYHRWALLADLCWSAVTACGRWSRATCPRPPAMWRG